MTQLSAMNSLHRNSIRGALGSTLNIDGAVIGGRGNARAVIHENLSELNAKLGVRLVEGTLNIVLTRPLHLLPDSATTFAGGARLLWPMLINGMPVWACRWRHSPLHVLELLSPIRLRAALNLSDGDEVVIGVHRSDIAPLSSIARLAWAFWWRGRREWYYTGDRYKDHAKRWCRYFSATQQIVSREA